MIAAILQRFDREQSRDHGTFVVLYTAPIDHIAKDLARIRIMFPSTQIASRHRINMANNAKRLAAGSSFSIAIVAIWILIGLIAQLITDPHQLI